MRWAQNAWRRVGKAEKQYGGAWAREIIQLVDDEIAPMKDPRVQANPAYLSVILLSRVITQLGTLEHINPKVIEGLFAADMAHLQDLYRRINDTGSSQLMVTCPHCGKQFEVETEHVGES